MKKFQGSDPGKLRERKKMIEEVKEKEVPQVK
jgi:hypothetical protein